MNVGFHQGLDPLNSQTMTMSVARRFGARGMAPGKRRFPSALALCWLALCVAPASSQDGGPRTAAEDQPWNAGESGEDAEQQDMVSCKVHDIQGLSRTGPGGSVRVMPERFFIPERCTQVRGLAGGGGAGWWLMSLSVRLLLSQVNLAELDLTDEAVMPLGRYLPSSPSMRFLNLGSNHVSDEGVRHLMAGVAHSKLTHLNLAYNDLTDRAMATVASVIIEGCNLQVSYAEAGWGGS